MSTFWHAFIIAITVLSIAACVWLLFANARGTVGEQTGHVWDDDLREYNNPLPRWWLNLFILTIVFGIGYLIAYPGLGLHQGRLGWSSGEQMQARLDALTARRQAIFASIAGLDVAQLSGNATALALGASVFETNCAGCHGADAQGAIGFPNLRDHDWLYGGTPDAVVASIARGRGGIMPPMNGALSKAQLDVLLDFVPRWSDPTLPAAKREAGLAQFRTTCAACHGADGQGNALVGAPNLTDDVWLYGGGRRQIREGILFGHQGRMPAHEDLLSPDEIRVVAAYVLSLSRTPAQLAAAE